MIKNHGTQSRVVGQEEVQRDDGELDEKEEC
jgi:hypothetical protein